MKFFKKKVEKEKLSKKEKTKLKKLKIEKRKKRKEDLKNKLSKHDFNPIFGGMAVGIANIIPGVSGGTMLVIFNLFDKLMYAISDIFKKKTDTRKQSIILIFKVFIGCAIGIVAFAKILGFTLQYMEAETIFWFMGLILFSVPIVVKQEMKNQKFSLVAFIMGFLFIIGIAYLKSKNPTNDLKSDMNFMHIITLIILGMIGGATMIFPGVSGSMVLLVLGKYEMIRSYIDKLTSFNKEAIISLGIFAIGVAIGIIGSAKITNYLLNNHKSKTMSVILGFIIASAIILPLNIENKVELNSPTLCACIASFVLGGIVIYYINRIQNKKSLD